MVGSGTPEHPAAALYVHSEVLSKLPFFAAALNGSFLEATTRVVNMPEDSPEIVAKLMQFLYTGNYTIAEEKRDGNDGDDIDDDTNLPWNSEREGLSNFRLWNRGRAMPPPVALPQIATPSGYPLGLISTNLTLPRVPVPKKSSTPSGRYYRKLFHASVFIMAEKYDCQGLVMLACTNLRNVTIRDKWELLDYWASVYEMSPPQSALRISNSLSQGTMFTYTVGLTQDWILRLWEDEGAGSGARRKEGRLTQVLAELPELGRDLLVLVSGATK